jgi:hypothetical protein
VTLKELRDRAAEMVTELLALSHGFSFETVMDMPWNEFAFWYKKVVQTAKKLRGVS